jgi:transposase
MGRSKKNLSKRQLARHGIWVLRDLPAKEIKDRVGCSLRTVYNWLERFESSEVDEQPIAEQTRGFPPHLSPRTGKHG